MMRYLVHRAGVFSGVALICLVSGAKIAHAASFKYDIYATPHTLPTQSPYTFTETTPAGSPTHDVSGNTLVLGDTSTSSPGYSYFIDPVTVVPALGPTSQYQIRSRAKINSYAGSGTGTVALYVARIIDNSRIVGFGMSRDSVTSKFKFFFTDNNGLNPSQIGTPYEIASPVDNDGFFNIALTKTGTSGTAADTVTLTVDGVFADSLSYTTFGTTATRQVRFGSLTSSITGVVEVTGASFGINEDAPGLLPEPASLSLLPMIGACFAFRRRGALR